jgi:hypothetical protein
MSSVRLTQDLRDRILNNYMDSWDKTNKRPESFKEETAEADLAEALRLRLIGDYDLSSIPQSFFKTANSVKAQLPDGFRWLYYRDSENNTEYRITPSQDGAIVLSETDGLYTKYKKAKREFKEKNKAYEEWQANRKEIRQKVRGVLSAVNSTKQLLVNWPEASVFLPDFINGAATVNFPAVSITDLNKQAGI